MVRNSVYDKLPNLILGFHGCNKDTFDDVLHNHHHLKASKNSYDWLGNGIYFWENSYERAFDWASHKYGEDRAVVGAVIDLGHCLNLTDYRSSEILRTGYKFAEAIYSKSGRQLPTNKHVGNGNDLLLRDLDCLVIEQIHEMSRTRNNVWEPFDSVRGVFIEGDSVYPGSGIPEKTHIQICIVNPNCIKGYFAPIEPDGGYSIP